MSIDALKLITQVQFVQQIREKGLSKNDEGRLEAKSKAVEDAFAEYAPGGIVDEKIFGAITVAVLKEKIEKAWDAAEQQLITEASEELVQITAAISEAEAKSADPTKMELLSKIKEANFSRSKMLKFVGMSSANRKTLSKGGKEALALWTEGASDKTLERIAASKNNLKKQFSDSNTVALLIRGYNTSLQQHIRDLCQPNEPSLDDLEALLGPDMLADGLERVETLLKSVADLVAELQKKGLSEKVIVSHVLLEQCSDEEVDAIYKAYGHSPSIRDLQEVFSPNAFIAKLKDVPNNLSERDYEKGQVTKRQESIQTTLEAIRELKFEDYLHSMPLRLRALLPDEGHFSPGMHSFELKALEVGLKLALEEATNCEVVKRGIGKTLKELAGDKGLPRGEFKNHLSAEHVGLLEAMEQNPDKAIPLAKLEELEISLWDLYKKTSDCWVIKQGIGETLKELAGDKGLPREQFGNHLSVEQVGLLKAMEQNSKVITPPAKLEELALSLKALHKEVADCLVVKEGVVKEFIELAGEQGLTIDQVKSRLSEEHATLFEAIMRDRKTDIPLAKLQGLHASLGMLHRITASKNNLTKQVSDPVIATLLFRGCSAQEQSGIRNLCKPNEPTLGDLEKYLSSNAFAEGLERVEALFTPITELVAELKGRDISEKTIASHVLLEQCSAEEFHAIYKLHGSNPSFRNLQEFFGPEAFLDKLKKVPNTLSEQNYEKSQVAKGQKSVQETLATLKAVMSLGKINFEKHLQSMPQELQKFLPNKWGFFPEQVSSSQLKALDVELKLMAKEMAACWVMKDDIKKTFTALLADQGLWTQRLRDYLSEEQIQLLKAINQDRNVEIPLAKLQDLTKFLAALKQTVAEIGFMGEFASPNAVNGQIEKDHRLQEEDVTIANLKEKVPPQELHMAMQVATKGSTELQEARKALLDLGLSEKEICQRVNAHSDMGTNTVESSLNAPVSILQSIRQESEQYNKKASEELSAKMVQREVQNTRKELHGIGLSDELIEKGLPTAQRQIFAQTVKGELKPGEISILKKLHETLKKQYLETLKKQYLEKVKEEALGGVAPLFEEVEEVKGEALGGVAPLAARDFTNQVKNIEGLLHDLGLSDEKIREGLSDDAAREMFTQAMREGAGENLEMLAGLHKVLEERLALAVRRDIEDLVALGISEQTIIDKIGGDLEEKPASLGELQNRLGAQELAKRLKNSLQLFGEGRLEFSVKHAESQMRKIAAELEKMGLSDREVTRGLSAEQMEMLTYGIGERPGDLVKLRGIYKALEEISEEKIKEDLIDRLKTDEKIALWTHLGFEGEPLFEGDIQKMKDACTIQEFKEFFGSELFLKKLGQL